MIWLEGHLTGEKCSIFQNQNGGDESTGTDGQMSHSGNEYQSGPKSFRRVCLPRRKCGEFMMNFRSLRRAGCMLLLLCSFAQLSFAQSAATLPVPRMIRFGGRLRDASTGTVGMTFALYKEQQGGAALWLESQNVAVDENGRYEVLLGANHADGIPGELFTGGEARWLGVQPEGWPEQERVMLLSVPYAMKAADAETLGGRPLSAFVLADARAGTPVNSLSSPSFAFAPELSAVTATINAGTANFVPKYADATALTNSNLVDNAGKIGIGTASPESILDIAANSSQTVRFGTVPWALRIGSLQSGTQFIGIAVTKTAANNNYVATSKNISTVNHTIMEFAYDGSMKLKQQAHQNDGTVLTPTTSFALTPAGNVGIGIDKPTQKLDVTGNIKITGTGNGLIFPDGTVQKSAVTNSGLTGVTAGTGLSGGGTAGAPVLSLNTAYTDGRYASLAAANSFGADQTVLGTLTMNGALSNGNIRITGTGNGLIFPDGTVQKSAVTSSGVTGVTAGTGLSAVGTSGSVALSLNTAYTDGRYAGLSTANTFRADQAVVGSLNISGALSSGAQIVQGDIVAAGKISSSALNARLGPEAAGGVVVGATVESEDGTGIEAVATTTTGSATAIHASVNSPAGFAGIFDNLAGGSILLGRVKIGDYWVKKFRVDGNGRVYANSGYSTGGADFAESFAVSGYKGNYQPGDVLIIDRNAPRQLALSADAYSTLVAGVYSTRPGVLASPYDMDDPNLVKEVPLAVVGVVPCKVTAENGPIHIGDMLVTSSVAGHAMKGTDRARMLGAVVGKALQDLESGTGVIEILVSLQ